MCHTLLPTPTLGRASGLIRRFSGWVHKSPVRQRLDTFFRVPQLFFSQSLPLATAGAGVPETACDMADRWTTLASVVVGCMLAMLLFSGLDNHVDTVESSSPSPSLALMHAANPETHQNTSVPPTPLRKQQSRTAPAHPPRSAVSTVRSKLGSTPVPRLKRNASVASRAATVTRGRQLVSGRHRHLGGSTRSE